MNQWRCDVCGKETFLNPLTEPIMESKEIEIEVDGAKLKKTIEVQKTIKMRTMDYSRGVIVESEVGAVKDLAPRAHIIRLTAGQQSIQHDFCQDCLDKLPEIKKFWDFMESIGNKRS